MQEGVVIRILSGLNRCIKIERAWLLQCLLQSVVNQEVTFKRFSDCPSIVAGEDK